ncbi:transketolase family protein [Saccharothrix coeruleofusca]|uniref:Transketolase n=1 Tax=Saccharothrix coeruleofusca TaxID=33919 RepID=A0A918EGV1_9PSEU|nr:transketolase C-terminal domain-containing protein [Saccharothrix coeruleofusca]MBP2335992.1 transketolase [Saccharothrix coeruleofusca]GGP76135.1 transketolase [Saccharothrix coeruleofusca]
MSGTTMRAACAPLIEESVRRCADVMTLGADGHALFAPVLRTRPDRFVEVGIAEANLVGIAAGLARTGWRPVVGAMAPFLVRRAYEQLRVDVSIPRLPVVLLGVGGGLSYGALGPTHHTVDDVALMSALPSMDIYCPADAADAAAVLRHCLPPAAPTYVRLTARQDPQVFSADTVGDPREVRLLRDGRDVLVLATGRCAAEALAAADECADRGVDVAVGVVTCLRPFPDAQVAALAQRWPLIVTAAEALRFGGLGARVAAAVADHPVRLVQLAVDHRHPPVAAHEELLGFYGLDRTAIAAAVATLLVEG